MLFGLKPNSQSQNYRQCMEYSAESWYFDLGSEGVQLNGKNGGGQDQVMVSML